MMAWLFWSIATLLFTSELLFAFIKICGASWTASTYHIWLAYVAFALYALAINTLGYRLLPWLSTCMIWFINFGSVFVFIALLARAHPKQAASAVFIDVVNETGWASNGWVFFLSFLPGITCINGFDSAAHMADEMPEPAKQIPQVMLGTVLLCGLSGIPMVIMFLFCIVEPDNLLDPVGGQPIFQLFVDSLNSLPLTIICCLIYIAVFIYACGSITTTASRVWWSFARSGALPASRWTGQVQARYQLPVNAIISVIVVDCVVGVLVFGPKTVIANVCATAAVCFFVSYALPICCFLCAGRRSAPVARHFNLGPAGPAINAISVVWALFISIIQCFPLYLPVTTSNMNYVPVVLTAGVVIFGGNWVLHAGKEYRVPEPMTTRAACIL